MRQTNAAASATKPKGGLAASRFADASAEDNAAADESEPPAEGEESADSMSAAMAAVRRTPESRPRFD